MPTKPTKTKKYAAGSEVVFNSKHGKSIHSGKTAEVTIHGNGTDESGVAHGIKFGNGHEMWAYPQELTPVN